MKPKIIVLIIALLFIGGINTYSQDHGERLRSLKIGYITESIELTSDEAEKFWPIYNLHQNNIHQLRHIDTRKLRHKIKDESNFNEMSENEARNLLNNLLKKEEDIINEQKLMFETLTTVLPAKKLLKLYKAENDFNRRIFQEYRKRSKTESIKRSKK